MAGDVTKLLEAHRAGNPDALKQVIGLVYREVLALAHRQRRQPDLHRTSSLAHAALERLMVEAAADWQNRGHFFAVLGRTMRRVMVDEVRTRHAQKRGGGALPEVLDDDSVGNGRDLELVVTVNDALEKMEAFNQRMARVAECRIFGGLTEDETAVALEVPLRTVQRDWQRARAWLKLALK